MTSSLTSSTLRVAMFNVAMSEPQQGRILSETASHNQRRFKNLAAIIQHVNPDVLLLCEFDHCGHGGDDGSVDNFCQHYLAQPQGEQLAVDYPYRYCPATNTGLLSPVDLNGDGVCTLPEDGFGFGEFHGHFGFVLLSKYPIDAQGIRTWQQLRWKAMPNALLPTRYYSPEAQDVLRISSKNHVVVPIHIAEKTINLVCCHPTPPVFDGPERRNLKRNHDEIQLIIDIIESSPYLLDDKDQKGGLGINDDFIVMGDLNADVNDGDGDKNAIKKLLKHQSINQTASHGKYTPRSLGGKQHYSWKKRRGCKSQWTHLSGLRLDYVLPSKQLTVVDSGVFWPDKADPLRPLITNRNGKETPAACSDHRMVWVDIALP